MAIEDNILELIESNLNADNIRVVSVKFISPNGNKTLQIMVDVLDESRPVNISDCEAASEIVSAILDVEDIIDDKYHLEISTPGIDRPLVTLRDYQRFVGHWAKVTFYSRVGGSNKFNAVIKKVEEDKITIGKDDIEVVFEVSEVKSAKLILTDELMKFCKDELDKLQGDENNEK